MLFLIFLVSLCANWLLMQEIKKQSEYRRQLRERILDVAKQAFAHNGIKAVKMDDISNALSISKRTLYELYGDKENLLFEVVRQADQQRRSHLRQYAEESHHVMEIILEAYRLRVKESYGVNPTFYTDISLYPKIVRFMEEEHEKRREEFNRFMRRGVEEGFFRPDVDYDMLPHLFDAIGRHVQREKLFQVYSLKEIFATLLLVPLRGISTEKGLRVLDSAEL